MSFPTTHLRSVVTPDGAVILDLKHDALLTLNSAGGYVWTRLLQGKSIPQIASELALETGADLGTVQRDIQAFLDGLSDNHLLPGNEK